MVVVTDGGAGQRNVKGDIAWWYQRVVRHKEARRDIACWWKRVVQLKEARRKHSVVVAAGGAAQRSEKKT